MKKIAILSIAGLIFPLYGMMAILSSYLPHVYYTSIIAHSVIVMIICSTALSICYFFYVNYVENKNVRFLGIALFFWILGIVYFLHTISIPSFFFLNEEIFDITEHFGLLFASSVLLFISLSSPAMEGFFHRNKRSLFLYSLLVILVWFVVMVFSHALGVQFSKYIDHAILLSGVILACVVIALLRDRTVVVCYASYLYFIVGLSVLVNAAIIPFFYKEWNVLWWYFHFIVLCAEIIIFIGILKKCDKKVCKLS